MYPFGDLDHSQNLRGSKLDKDKIISFFHENPTSSICIIITNKSRTKRQTNGHESNNSLVCFSFVDFTNRH